MGKGDKGKQPETNKTKNLAEDSEGKVEGNQSKATETQNLTNDCKQTERGNQHDNSSKGTRKNPSEKEKEKLSEAKNKKAESPKKNPDEKKQVKEMSKGEYKLKRSADDVKNAELSSGEKAPSASPTEPESKKPRKQETVAQTLAKPVQRIFENDWAEERRKKPFPNNNRNGTNYSDYAYRGGGRGGRASWQKSSHSTSDFRLSKTMSFLLRHGAEKLRLPIQPDGFMYVDDLLRYRDLTSYTEDDVKRVVRENDKKRFFLTEDPVSKRLKVRANQGHTFEVPDLDLQPIINATDVPAVIHGTYHKAWSIIKRQGLNRMSRNHIHFTFGEPGADGVISGMRGSCEVLIYIDLERALNDGIQFFRSANDVILSPGDDRGIIGPKYFKSAIQRNSRMKLDLATTS